MGEGGERLHEWMWTAGNGPDGVVALHGELDLADVPAVASHMIAAVAACGPSVIVDLAGLDFIDCCGLGVLVRVLKWTRESGGDVLLAAPQPDAVDRPDETGQVVVRAGLGVILVGLEAVGAFCTSRDKILAPRVIAAGSGPVCEARAPDVAAAGLVKVSPVVLAEVI